jgi:glycerophosphoryl diester phosphodiesterase
MSIMPFLMMILPLAGTPESILPPPNNGGVYVVAHRGAHEGIPENTVPAYVRAIELGADFVEIDARTTKDGQFVCIHNATIDGYVEGVKGRVKDMTLAEIKALDVGAKFGPQWKDARIPTVEEALDCCKGKIGIYMDVKDAPLEKLVPMIKARGMERRTLWYGGGPIVERLRTLSPECIAMPDPHTMQGLPKLLEAHKPKVVAAVWDAPFSAEFVDLCHKSDALVIVDDDGPETWQKALDWHTDGIQTDSPSKLIELLKTRAPAK